MAPVYPHCAPVQFPDLDGMEVYLFVDPDGFEPQEDEDNRFPGDAMLSDPE